MNFLILTDIEHFLFINIFLDLFSDFSFDML